MTGMVYPWWKWWPWRLWRPSWPWQCDVPFAQKTNGNVHYGPDNWEVCNVHDCLMKVMFTMPMIALMTVRSVMFTMTTVDVPYRQWCPWWPDYCYDKDDLDTCDIHTGYTMAKEWLKIVYVFSLHLWTNFFQARIRIRSNNAESSNNFPVPCRLGEQHLSGLAMYTWLSPSMRLTSSAPASIACSSATSTTRKFYVTIPDYACLLR